MRTFLFLFVLLCSLPASALDTIRPFRSDGCSYWVNGDIIDPDLWRNCCFEHDISYWMGGSRAQRKAADKRLKACVAEKYELTMGVTMFIGVHLAGGPEHLTTYRWGYGWPWGRGYRELNLAEKEMVVDELQKTSFSGEEKALIDSAVEILQ